jgi:hypothetical protein
VPFPRVVYNPGEVGSSPFWHERRVYSRHEAWEYLWVSAAHGPHPYAIPGSAQVIHLQLGETPPLAVRRLMQIWGWKSKRKVEEFLSSLLDLGEIEKGQRTKFGDTYVFAGASPKRVEGDAGGTETGRTRDAGGTIEKDVEKGSKGNNPSPPTGEKRAPVRTRGGRRVAGTETPLPADWEPNDRHAEIALREGRDLGKEADRFKSNAEAKGLVYVSWNSAFSTWLTSEYGKPLNGNGKARSNGRDNDDWRKPIPGDDPANDQAFRWGL